jgi:hypothetical protein
MPKIEVSEETLKFLSQCQTELKTQDSRCTRNVIFFNKYPTKVYAECNDKYHEEGYSWLNYDHTECLDDTEKLVDYFDESLDEEEYNTIREIYNFDVENMDKKPEFKSWLIDIIDEKGDRYIDNLYDIFINVFEDMFEDMKFNIEKLDFIKRYNYTRISYSKGNDRICESGLFSFFGIDVAEHKRLDGHNYMKNQYSYGGSIQRSPYMLQLREWLLNQDFNNKE